MSGFWNFDSRLCIFYTILLPAELIYRNLQGLATHISNFYLLGAHWCMSAENNADIRTMALGSNIFNKLATE